MPGVAGKSLGGGGGGGGGSGWSVEADRFLLRLSPPHMPGGPKLMGPPTTVPLLPIPEDDVVVVVVAMLVTTSLFSFLITLSIKLNFVGSRAKVKSRNIYNLYFITENEDEM